MVRKAYSRLSWPPLTRGGINCPLSSLLTLTPEVEVVYIEAERGVSVSEVCEFKDFLAFLLTQVCVVPANGAVTQGAMAREDAIKEDQSVFIHYISVLVLNKDKAGSGSV